MLNNFGAFSLFELDSNGNSSLVATSTECYDTVNGGTTDEGLVIIDFDFQQALTKGNRYSFVAIHSDNNDVASFGASFIFEDTSVATCNVNDTAWNDTTDSPETLTTENDFINRGLESCNVTGSSLTLDDLLTNGVNTVTLRRIDLNPNETEYSEFHIDGTMSLALDDGTIPATWTHNESYGISSTASKVTASLLEKSSQSPATILPRMKLRLKALLKCQIGTNLGLVLKSKATAASTLVSIKWFLFSEI